ncbi:MAG: T9SS type A sorting domain-containing protein [Bacteroidetes bacterium]|nr:T9SS type A sorting domain-containing protein [Bacteroidota bacterium]
MKKLLFLSFALFVTLKCLAQNWECIKANERQYFINNTDYLRGIRVDSVKQLGNKTFYYPFHTPRGQYVLPDGNPSPTSLDTNSGSWLGKKVTVLQDGTWQFDNHWGDTVFLKASAHFGDNWMFYDDTSNRHYSATVTSIDTMTILTTLDSVKTITLTSYIGANVNANDPLNNAEIVLSKNHGFAQVVDLYMFPFHGPDSAAYAQGFDYYTDCIGVDSTRILFKQIDFRNPDNSDLYSYEAGDVFEWSGYDYCSPFYILDSIVAKAVLGPSAVQYIKHHRYWKYDVNSQSTINQFSVDTLQVSVGYHTLIDTVLMPEENGIHEIFHFNPADSTHCYRSAVYYIDDDMIVGDMVNTFEPCGNGAHYKDGIGLTDNYICTDANPCGTYSSDLSFSYKISQGQPCGQLIPLRVNELSSRQNQLIISPNPCQYYCAVSSDQIPYTISIYNILGQKMLEKTCSNKKETLDISQLSPGLYQVRQIQKNSINNTTLLEIQR